MNPDDGIAMAAAFAVAKQDVRAFRLGAVGKRNDGAIVLARNGSGLCRVPSAHAEARLSRKLDVGSTVFVARVLRDGRWANAKPCLGCFLQLRARGVRRVFYTVGDRQYMSYMI